jgi:endogenous inhibitor of DNA gyrase (YacG/DUF329 family)
MKTCRMCGGPVLRNDHHLFCSASCQHQASRDLKINGIEKICQECGAEFVGSKFVKKSFCCKNCEKRYEKLHGVVQPVLTGRVSIKSSSFIRSFGRDYEEEEKFPNVEPVGGKRFWTTTNIERERRMCGCLL